MRELDIMTRAKQYMDLLSQGIDPVSQRRIPSDSALNQPRLQKCFAYVAHVLQKDMEALAAPPQQAQQPSRPSARRTAAPPTAPKAPAQQPPTPPSPPQASAAPQQTPPADRPAPPLPEGAITFYDFCYQLAASIHLSNASPLKQAISNWLRCEGYAAYAQEDEEGYWDVTEKGLAAGLSTNGHLLCLEQGQAFLREQLNTILAWNSTQWEPLLEVLTPELSARILCSEEPVSMTQFLKRIQGLLPPDLPRKLTAQFINKWLEQEGYLEQQIQGQDRKWVPSEQGRAAGILTKGSSALLYNGHAQRFVADHLRDAALACQSLDLFREA